MKKLLKKAIGVFLTVAMVLSTVPVSNQVFANTGSHECGLGGEAIALETLIAENGGNSEIILKNGSIYYLSEDITIERDLVVEDVDGAHVALCLNGNTLSFEDGAYLKEPIGTYCYVNDCSANPEDKGKVIADLKAELLLTTDARALVPEEYKKLMDAGIVMYDGDDPNSCQPLHTSSLDKSDKSQWVASFDDVPLYEYSDENDGYERHDLNVTFKDHVIDYVDDGEGNSYGVIGKHLSSSNANINIDYRMEKEWDEEIDWYVNNPISDEEMKLAIYADAHQAVAVTVNLENPDNYSEGDVNLLLEGEVIRTDKVDTESGIHFQYLDGEFDDQQQDWGELALPAFMDGFQSNYSVELSDSCRFAKCTSLEIVNNIEEYGPDVYPAYVFTYTYTVMESTEDSRIANVDIQMDDATGGLVLPTTATTSADGVKDEVSIEWYDGNELLGEGTLAEADKQYTGHFIIEPEEETDKYLSNQTEVSVNEKPANKVKKNSDNSLVAEYIAIAGDNNNLIFGPAPRSVNPIALLNDDLPDTPGITDTPTSDTPYIPGTSRGSNDSGEDSKLDERNIPDQDGDGKDEQDSDGDGFYEGTKDGRKYVTDDKGNVEEVTDPDRDGIYDGKDGDGDGKPDNRYIADQDGDGIPEPDSDGDGVFEGTKDGKKYVTEDSSKEKKASDKADNDKKNYEVVDGELVWITGSTEDLTFTIDAPAKKFKKLFIGGEKVSKGDYSYISGSTIITIEADYLNSLDAGSYDVEAVYTDGNAATTLSVTMAAGGAGVGTGDDSNILLWFVIATAAAAGGVGTLIPRRRASH